MKGKYGMRVKAGPKSARKPSVVHLHEESEIPTDISCEDSSPPSPFKKFALPFFLG